MIPKLCFDETNSKNKVCRFVTILLNTVLFNYSVMRPVRWASSLHYSNLYNISSCLDK